MKTRSFKSVALLILSVGFLQCSATTLWARTRVENICTVYGMKEIKLSGMGLVVGLDGTGDGGKNLPTIRSLAAALKHLNNPVVDLKDLTAANNVALVLIEATIPASGIRKGQKLDCFVSSMLGAKSLRGGRLLVAPASTTEIGNEVLAGLCSGAVILEDETSLATGRIINGLVMERNFELPFIDRRTRSITLLIDRQHTGFHTASEVSRVINSEFSFEAGNQALAIAQGPGRVFIRIPKQYMESPVEFVAAVMEVGIDRPHQQARVVVNPKSQTVVVTGEVEISPVIISHKNLTVGVGNVEGGLPGGFVPLVDQQGQQSTQRLQQLVEALNQLRVPTEDVISIIRELHRSGKLHAEYDEH
ncbi:Flagellar P-ring protein precursor [Gimesia alba]|uniref:Flagellar P-ring protein n=1 Tax=Gimesia alba TaxID=2527973 RepID=A0A517RAN4_9PLAN|nr:flagellar basal body P-ring protein FlgI [Gimesia alba]QDT40853.1 Flagellar P-ring protein precursor [Gimesia alba]